MNVILIDSDKKWWNMMLCWGFTWQQKVISRASVYEMIDTVVIVVDREVSSTVLSMDRTVLIQPSSLLLRRGVYVFYFECTNGVTRQQIATQ